MHGRQPGIRPHLDIEVAVAAIDPDLSHVVQMAEWYRLIRGGANGQEIA
jgi:hypothetical protein